MTPDHYALAALAVILIGVSKAGFGGGTAVLSTPLMAMALSASEAVAVLLPLLVLTDWIAVSFHWRRWRWAPILRFLPGCVAGIGVGTLLLGTVSDRWLAAIIGLICVGFCLVRWLGGRTVPPREPRVPGWGRGTGFGLVAGLTSTLAHAAGPVFAMYLLPSGYARRQFVAIAVLTFTFVNLIKVPGYWGAGIFSRELLFQTLWLIPWVPVGALLGLWLHHRISENGFLRVIYLILFLSGIKLILDGLVFS